MIKDEPFKTESMALAAFLMSNGMTLVLVTPPDDDGIQRFVLIDTANRPDLVEQWEAKEGDARIAWRMNKYLRICKGELTKARNNG